MFEISDETLKEMQQIKDTCEFLECRDCNYYDESKELNGDIGCELNFPFNWILEYEEGEKNEK